LSVERDATSNHNWDKTLNRTGMKSGIRCFVLLLYIRSLSTLMRCLHNNGISASART
jgi:hypothetical protein